MTDIRFDLLLILRDILLVLDRDVDEKLDIGRRLEMHSTKGSELKET